MELQAHIAHMHYMACTTGVQCSREKDGGKRMLEPQYANMSMVILRESTQMQCMIYAHNTFCVLLIGKLNVQDCSPL